MNQFTKAESLIICLFRGIFCRLMAKLSWNTDKDTIKIIERFGISCSYIYCISLLVLLNVSVALSTTVSATRKASVCIVTCISIYILACICILTCIYISTCICIHNLAFITALTCDRSADQRHKWGQVASPGYLTWLLHQVAPPACSRDTSDQFFDIYFLGNLFACH